ncbi:hypothetical protein BLNAU_8294 [Blattamonas nauphoetae]|uniref:Uncharacterized protein n=1 Tax=Blattamonas nauphoetae TaxID=2049346 RepID=A0ABQ9XYU0_9EUKA|nr:hypothetical protein BLNAU_8294 [Blattamonas nauphoetae]
MWIPSGSPCLDIMPRISLENIPSDCHPFLKWNETKLKSDIEKTVVFRSLVASVKLLPPFAYFLEERALILLEYVTPNNKKKAESLLNNLASFSDAPLTDLIQSIVELLHSANLFIPTAAMKMLKSQCQHCSEGTHLALVKADLIPQIISALNPQSRSFAKAEEIHSCLLSSLSLSFFLATPNGLRRLKHIDHDEQQAVYETIFQQVLVPSEKYICHLCASRYSIIDGELSTYFLPTMDLVLHMPVVLTIPSCLAFFQTERSYWIVLHKMNCFLSEWNEQLEEVPQMWKNVYRTLRMEGMDDVIEEKMRNDDYGSTGRWIIIDSINFGNRLGINLPKQEEK